jgi:hypothetical protein
MPDLPIWELHRRPEHVAGQLAGFAGGQGGYSSSDENFSG